MASGFGITGSQGRCYPLWTDFSDCMNKAEEPQACFALREDYIECLHHRKEYSRMNEVTRQHQKNIEAKMEKMKAEVEAILKKPAS